MYIGDTSETELFSIHRGVVRDVSMFLGVLEVMDETDEMVVIEVMDDEMVVMIIP